VNAWGATDSRGLAEDCVTVPGLCWVSFAPGMGGGLGGAVMSGGVGVIVRVAGETGGR